MVLDVPGKSVNTCTPQVLEELSAVLPPLAASRVKAVIIASAKPRSFNVGADLFAIRDMGSEEGKRYLALGQGVFQRLASLPVPTVAAINGHCLGGGMELALACTYRVAADDPAISLGLPEVTLGLIPAWAGTTRLPGMIGLEKALPILLGRTVPPAEAKAIGMIDELVPRDALLDAARRLVTSGRPPRRSTEEPAAARERLLEAARRDIQGRAPGHNAAPLRLLDVLRTGYERGFAAGLEAELEAILALRQTEATRDLMRLFFERQAAKRQPPA
jgi:3-hydroxyacyl-CoA dehydrogenase/enoyl-CoA hydratase/3-hydroxybutyryl-CoA epimerase